MTDKHQNTEPLLSKQTLLPASLTKLAKKVISQNRAIGNKIAIAESCTGGLVAASLTEIPGSSEVLDRAFITYSNDAKIECLKVDQKIIDLSGAVSISCVSAMAQGALKRSSADIAVAISGVAGPGGGTEQRPVGTVVFARATRSDIQPLAELKKFNQKDRSSIRFEATLYALKLLLP